MSDIMTTVLYICLCVCVFSGVSCGVSTKMDFGVEEEDPVIVETNSTKVQDEDVEVEHTIVVSTKLKNNNRRGLHSSNDGGGGALTYKIGGRETKEDSGEVPVVTGYKAVESTLIRTPDTRLKNQPRPSVIPESVFINRNVQDQYDIYPNYVDIPNNWKPSTFYNNINWYNQESDTALPLSRDLNPAFRNTYNSRPAYQTPGKFHRGITDDGIKEFYCKKCRELQGFRDCAQSRSNSWPYVQTTTPKIKLDGKLAKLN